MRRHVLLIIGAAGLSGLFSSVLAVAQTNVNTDVRTQFNRISNSSVRDTDPILPGFAGLPVAPATFTAGRESWNKAVLALEQTAEHICAPRRVDTAHARSSMGKKIERKTELLKLVFEPYREYGKIPQRRKGNVDPIIIRRGIANMKPQKLVCIGLLRVRTRKGVDMMDVSMTTLRKTAYKFLMEHHTLDVPEGTFGGVGYLYWTGARIPGGYSQKVRFTNSTGSTSVGVGGGALFPDPSLGSILTFLPSWGSSDTVQQHETIQEITMLLLGNATRYVPYGRVRDPGTVFRVVYNTILPPDNHKANGKQGEEAPNKGKEATGATGAQ